METNRIFSFNLQGANEKVWFVWFEEVWSPLNVNCTNNQWTYKTFVEDLKPFRTLKWASKPSHAMTPCLLTDILPNCPGIGCNKSVQTFCPSLSDCKTFVQLLFKHETVLSVRIWKFIERSNSISRSAQQRPCHFYTLDLVPWQFVWGNLCQLVIRLSLVSLLDLEQICISVWVPPELV